MVRLDGKTVQVIKETAPVLKQHSQGIGKRFYQLLFEKHPELLHLFNQTNQRRGIQQQALAYSVYTAGEHIDRLEEMKPVITRICHKHRAIGIIPEQYPIVGQTLIQAVKDVLGEQVNEEILQAWEQAYQYIADVFMEMEKELYKEIEEQPGGWTGFRDFVVDKKVTESDVMTSFYLKPTDGKPIASYQPGQYLTLRAKIPGEKYDHIRHYSLSEAPGKDYYRITVKREDASDVQPQGIVSNYLHRDVHPGNILQFSAPAGDFIPDLKSEAPLVLIGGGVGLTPLISMLNTVSEKQPDRRVIYIHAAHDGNVHGMKDHVAQLADRSPAIQSYVCYTKPTETDRQIRNFDKEGHIDRQWLETLIPSVDSEFYLCGPIPFMKAINRSLLDMGVPELHIHFEAFSPMSVLEE